MNQQLQRAVSHPPQKYPVFSFEHGVPPHFIADERSRLSISDHKYKDGRSSLQWTFSEGSSLTVFHPIGMKHAGRDVFACWMYNEQPVDDELIFEFGCEGNVAARFAFRLNFRGWRTAWVPFRDMEGNPHDKMDRLIIKAPATVKQGTIYFDQMILATPVDVRHPTRDAQVPFVNRSRDTSASGHWQALLMYDEFVPNEVSEVEATTEEIAAVERLEQQLSALAGAPADASEQEMQLVRAHFQSFGIVHDEKGIRGRPVDLIHLRAIYPSELSDALTKLANSVDVKDYTDFMLKIALYYAGTGSETYRSEFKTMFLDLVFHFKDQGWDWGHSLGTNHHLGYNIRSMYPALLLMKPVLEEAGLLPWAQRTMRWFSGLGRIFEPLEESYANVDILNTKLQGMLASILMMDRLDQEVFFIRRLTAWLSSGMLPAPGLMPAFKPDGSGFHHMSFYPAYVRDALLGLTPVVMLLSKTPFRISEQAHAMLKKVALAMRLYANKHEWLLSVCGRHPTGKERLFIEPYKYLALAGTPDGKEEIDPDMAAAYLRLAEDQEDSTVRKLRKMGFKAEDDPNGHWTMNYGTLALHRRSQWLVGVRGHHRYFWSNELYAKANWYGRYTTYGQIQIMSGQSNLESGYAHDGWDWNRWPGTTAIHLPFEKLKAKKFSELLLTDETYAGGLNLEGKNGMFAMKLHEHPRYEGSHRARKSVFMFNHRIIALGSNIENEDHVHATETTLFQNALIREDEKIWINSPQGVKAFPHEERRFLEQPAWLIDNKQNGYYLAAGQTIGIHKKRQHSKRQNDGQDTSGDFAAAWIDHGTAPQEAWYEYAVIIGADPAQMEDFTARMSASEPPYEVLQRDRDAHIVHDRETGITAYALFEANDSIQHGNLSAVDTPSMVMMKKCGEQLIVSAVDPDLRFYEGIDPDQYDEEGRFVGGAGPYTRPWRKNESRMHTLHLTIVGKWKLAEPSDQCRIAAMGPSQTTISVDCKDAMPVEFRLIPER